MSIVLLRPCKASLSDTEDERQSHPTAFFNRANSAMTQSFYSRAGKRWFDATCSFLGLVVLSPFLLLVALLVKLSSRGPIFFRQYRVGQHGRPFLILKFRTMKPTADGSGPLITGQGDPRITPVGQWLRKSKIDELPPLFNVLLGDMSLVGPRPEVPMYTKHYTDKQKAILIVKPGITGPSADVYEEEILGSQPDKESFYIGALLPAKLQIDLAYCAQIRFLGDVKLILLTFL